MQSYEKRYALRKLRYVAWGLSEIRAGSSTARFRSRVEAGAALPRLTVKKADEEHGSEEAIASLKVGNGLALRPVLALACRLYGPPKPRACRHLPCR